MITEEKKRDNLQMMVTHAESARFKALAKIEGRTVSQMLRILALESLQRWEKSANGRRQR